MPALAAPPDSGSIMAILRVPCACAVEAIAARARTPSTRLRRTFRLIVRFLPVLYFARSHGWGRPCATGRQAARVYAQAGGLRRASRRPLDRQAGARLTLRDSPAGAGHGSPGRGPPAGPPRLPAASA